MASKKADDAFRTWFDEYMGHWFDFAKEQIEESGDIEPHLMIVQAQSKAIAVTPALMDTASGKSATMRIQRILAMSDEVAGVVLVTGAWQLAVPSADKAEAERLFRETSLEDHPDKEEIVLWSALRGDMQLLAHALVVPKGEGKTLALHEIVDPNGQEVMKGRLTGNE